MKRVIVNAQYFMMTRNVLSVCLFLFLAATVSARNRIFGGTPININQVPFAAAFTLRTPQGNDNFFTGGVVLTSRHILSAAHSFPNPQNLPVHHVRLGSSLWASGGVFVAVQTAINHPDYNSANTDSDVSLVILNEAVPIGGGTGISNAVLPHPTTTLPAGMPISVAGWGLTEANTISAQLLNINIYVIDWELCRQRYSVMRALTVNMFCAGILNVAGIDACTGDSGGPAYSGGVVYGLVSWGAGCGDAHFPGVYVTVPNFTNWIHNIVNSS